MDDYCPMPTLSDLPGDDALRDALRQVRTVAVVGASPRPSRTSHQIFLWLLENTNWDLVPVNPTAVGETIAGHPIIAALSDMDTPPDLVDVFRRAEHVPEVATEAIAVGAKFLWLQLGISHDEAVASAQQSGLVTVQNRCIKVELQRLGLDSITVA